MTGNRILWILIVLAAAATLLGLWLFGVAADGATVSGIVVDATGPLAGARVRVRATDNLVFTDELGEFALAGLENGKEIEVTGWYTGYYISSAHVTPTVEGVTLTLRPYHTTDHPDYEWTSPITGTSAGACGKCHPMIVAQWGNNAHGEAIDNARFFSLYDGTNISGTSQIGPGYVLDFPATAGNCANCHAPAAGVDGYLTTAMDEVREVITAGIHCDFCHKVGDVYLDPASGSVYNNAPGAQSQQLLRPPAGDNIFFGPFDDIPDPDTYLPLISESAFCAPCHQFSFWGTPIYESFEEWLASPQAAAGVTCQECHMPPTGDEFFALPEVGGLPHPPEQIPSHLQLGASSVELLRETLDLTLSVQQFADRAVVTVEVANSGAGHHVPTDHPGRHVILTIVATDDQGQPLSQVSGPVVPDWGGEQAGSPGQAFAKVLADQASKQYPVVSYWKQTTIVSDNRIPAGSSRISSYTFTLPPNVGRVEISAQLIFRRLFQELATQKGWDAADIVMETGSATLSPQPVANLYLPLLSK